jgi:hypothetical protein
MPVLVTVILPALLTNKPLQEMETGLVQGAACAGRTQIALNASGSTDTLPRRTRRRRAAAAKFTPGIDLSMVPTVSQNRRTKPVPSN